MKRPTMQELIAGSRRHVDSAYERACAALEVELTKRVNNAAAQRAEYTGNAFPPAYRVRQWEADEAISRAVMMLTTHADEAIRLERVASAAYEQRVQVVTDAADAGVPVLLESNAYLLRRAENAEAENRQLWRESVEAGEREIMYLEKMRGYLAEIVRLQNQLKAATAHA